MDELNDDDVGLSKHPYIYIYFLQRVSIAC